MTRVLFAGTELYPYVKVGGLGDVMAALPRALKHAGADVRVVIPGFRAILAALEMPREVRRLPDLFGGGETRIVKGTLGGELPVYVVDCPAFFDRSGGPYDEWGDSARRFAAFSHAIARIGLEGDGDGFVPDVVHCNDWQTALAPLYIAHDRGPRRVATVMSIHNLAYQGTYPGEVHRQLHVPAEAFQTEGAEFHGGLSFLKAGIAYATKIATVSPTYAREITTPEGGFGLDGILRRRVHDLVGIVNGIDDELFDARRSPCLDVHFGPDDIESRALAKASLVRKLELETEPETPLFGVVSRLADIKGLDLVLANVDWLRRLGADLIVLGRGDPDIEARFRAAEVAHRGRICTWIGFDETLAQQVFAGVDVLLVPSRSEPCGLTQMYAMRYGALPLVRRTGGLADTVTEITPESVARGEGTGFLFDAYDGWALGEAIGRAVDLYRNDPSLWRQAQANGMRRDLGWGPSARRYLELYDSIATESA